GTQSQLFRNPPEWLPNPVLPGNYPEALTQLRFANALGNTVFITVLSLLGQLLSVTMVAFAFARLRWPGRQALFVVLLATMMVPPIGVIFLFGQRYFVRSIVLTGLK